jgi:hypothetical protein
MRAFARPGGPLAADSPNVTMNSPAWFRPATGIAAERIALHDRLIAEYKELHAAARHDRQVIVLAGLPGSGKSTVLGTDLDRRHGPGRPTLLPRYGARCQYLLRPGVTRTTGIR